MATPVITNVGLLWGVERWQHLLSLMLLYSIWMNEVQVSTRTVFVHAYSDDRLHYTGLRSLSQGSGDGRRAQGLAMVRAIVVHERSSVSESGHDHAEFH